MAFGEAVETGHPVQVKLKRFNNTLPAFQLFKALSDREQYCCLLESLEGPERLARFSIIGYNPRIRISIKQNSCTLHKFQENESTDLETNEPLRDLKALLANYENPQSDKRFSGGAIGYFSYDAARYWEKLPDTAENGQRFFDADFIIFNEGLIFDHASSETYRYSLDGSTTIELPPEDGMEAEPFHATVFNAEPQEERYVQMVEEAKRYIESGDIFQVVLSKRYPLSLQGDPIQFYQRLRSLNPSPYMYYLKFGGTIIAGSSPEMLVRVEGRSVETFPIAGTRPHSGDATEDALMSKELAGDPKERAEHLMLVDLARNDLGRVCDYGTVRVEDLMSIYHYSHVQHIVSHVVGRLRTEADAFDALRAVFPAGTVSGAPKIRAMEIIDEFERTRRGPYAGAIGYFSFNGNADFAITIRTLVAQDNQGSIQAGAGIVADSDPHREWNETEQKTQALVRALDSEED